MGRRKRTACRSPSETSVNGELPNDSTFFEDLCLDLQSLRIQWGLLSMTSIQEIGLAEDEMAAMLLSQIDLNDTFIESLSEKLDVIVAKGRGLEADNRYLKQKILDLEEERHDSRRTEFDDYKKHRDRSDTYSLNIKSEIDADSPVKNERLDDDVLDDDKNGESSPQVSREKSDSFSPSRRSPSPRKMKSETNSKERSVKNSKDSAEESAEKDKFKAMVAMAFKAQGYSFADSLKPDKSRDDLSSSNGDEDKKSSGVGWDTEGGQSISEQVEAIALDTVIQSGYVYQEELGLYYDHTSGYYYNAEDGLYYDPKTGTYFYFDHTSQAYQFHSQVPVEGSTAADTETGEQTNVDAAGNDGKETSGVEHPQEVPTDIPPSVRLMITESGVDKVKVGELHLVTINGGRVGRKPENLIQLLDVSVSKEHAEFIYHSNGPEDHHYFIKDLGSNLGTFINGTCICIPGEPSDEIEIGHGWELQFGSVKMKCHIHPGYLSCNECEPGIVRSHLASQSMELISIDSKLSIQKNRMKALKAMKKKYGINPHINQAPILPSSYEDRAKRRQTEIGSDNPYEKTEVASTETELKNTNKGFSMLQKMGWSKGQGLGKSQPGITKPIEATSTVGRGGLGFKYGCLPPTQHQAKRKKILDVTSQRFKKS